MDSVTLAFRRRVKTFIRVIENETRTLEAVYTTSREGGYRQEYVDQQREAALRARRFVSRLRVIARELDT